MLNFLSQINSLKQNYQVKNLSLTSSDLNESTAFVALPGQRHHGLDFFTEALAAKTPCIIIDAKENFFSDQIPVLRVENLIEQLGNFASAFYEHPSEKLAIYAITGTNGKTSCSQFIAQALAILGIPCGVIGTLGMGVWPALQTNLYTTPDAISLQRFLAECVEKNIYHISLEASSIALAAGRMQGCVIHTALFTNFTQDHLDYHHTMEAYADAKKSLFDFAAIKSAIINADDKLGKEILQQYHSKIPCWAISTQNQLADSLVNIKRQSLLTLDSNFTAEGIQAIIKSSDATTNLSSPLLGKFNLENLLIVGAWLLEYGLDLSQTVTILGQLKNVAGRMMRLGGKGQPLIVIDYAHTPDALEKALQTLRELNPETLWCLFGCGGNRDKGKRPLMGAIANRLADRIVVTTDNPRHEDPLTIIEEISSKLDREKTTLIIDRNEAIAYAIAQAKPQDIILIAGKGHETYQEIQGKRYEFNDFLLAEKYLFSPDNPNSRE